MIRRTTARPAADKPIQDMSVDEIDTALQALGRLSMNRFEDREANGKRIDRALNLLEQLGRRGIR